MFENNNELFSLYLNGEFQGYLNSEDYRQQLQQFVFME